MFLKKTATWIFRPTLLLTLLCHTVIQSKAETDPKFYSVQASAKVQYSPAQVRLEWSADSASTSYTVSRKLPREQSWGGEISLPGNTLSYEDNNVSLGQTYEYRIKRNRGGLWGGVAYGYLAVGVRGAMIENRGKVILVVDNSVAGALSAELSRLVEDLTGDGWTVVRHNVSRTDSPSNIRGMIRSDYLADPTQVNSVFIFGHVPVPYSGNFNPDGHPDHRGAWPADAFYGDMDGSWTDNSVNNGGAEKAPNRNTPGDGKFDQSNLPSDVELQVGRVDLFNMTCFANKSPWFSEIDLLRRYLDKDHSFRMGQMSVERRGVVCDNFGEMEGEAFAASGWRNFSALLGADQVSAVGYGQYFSTVKNKSYLMSYGTGGGGFYTCNGLGSTDDFVYNDVKSVFNFYFGSYFGDWDNESAFLKGALGSSGNSLTAAWAGRPHWFVHHMGVGETIGHGTRLSQNNDGLYGRVNYGSRGVHIALMGDPTLRLHPVKPATQVKATGGAAGVRIVWSASSDSSIQGYHLYRSSSQAGPFARVNGELVTENSFLDSDPQGSTVYMVRAVKLETSGSGSYLNPGQGAFASVIAGSTGEPVPTKNLFVKDGKFQLRIDGAPGSVYQIEDSNDCLSWKVISIITIIDVPFYFIDPNARQLNLKFYRAKKL